MLTRREFLHASATVAGATITLVLGPVACIADDPGIIQSVSETQPCDGASSTSGFSSGHTHELCVPLADLAAPPPEGRSLTASVEFGHTHAIALSADQLRALAQGQLVTVTSSTDEGHAHAFAIRRVT